MPHGFRRIATAALACCATALIGSRTVDACTAFCAVGGEQVLVGNNEDWNNPRTKIWFIPSTAGSFGRMYVGFDDLSPQGGMNERGLWFDGFATPSIGADGSSELPPFSGSLIDAAMAQCSTVDDVVRLFSQYDRSFLVRSILMFADASGDAVAIERNAIVRKTRDYFVQTNFHQSLQRGLRDGRFSTATAMLERAGGDVSIDLFRRILDATHQTGNFPTLYSNIYDLRSRTMYLYNFHDFERRVTFRLDDELKKGERVLDIPALFPRNTAAEAFSTSHPRAGSGLSGAEFAAILIGLPVVLLLLAAIAWARGGRQLRVGVSALLAVLAVLIVGIVGSLNMHPDAANGWMEFTIGPASGDWVSMEPGSLRAGGITVKAALAAAYEIAPVRVIGPEWLNHTRYAINAVAGVDKADTFRPLLRKELETRLRLETRLEVRPFDVFVLTVVDPARLPAARGESRRAWVRDRTAELKEAPMDAVTAALQSILGKPVVDETGLKGSYDLEFEWGEDRVGSLTATFRDRFGLQLTPAQRELEALIVAGIHRDPALLLLGQVGRASASAPAAVRQHISRLFTIR